MTQYVTCEECESNLEVRREGRTIIVDVLEAGQQMPQEDANNLVNQNDLESIDTERQNECKESEAPESSDNSLAGFFYVIAIFFGLIITVGALYACDPGGFWGLKLLALGIAGLYCFNKKISSKDKLKSLNNTVKNNFN